MAFEYLVGRGESAFVLRGGAYLYHQLIDSFEDSSLSEYTDTSGRYSAGSSTDAPDGSGILFFDGSQGSGAGLVSTSGLPRYPSPGDTFEAYTKFEYADDYGGIQFACQTESDTFPDGYRCQADGADDLIEILKHTGGGGTFTRLTSSGAGSLSLSNHLNEWLRHRVEWETNGDITYTLYDSTGSQIAQTPTTNDTTYTSGGFGWASETNSNLSSEQWVYHDYAYTIG